MRELGKSLCFVLAAHSSYQDKMGLLHPRGVDLIKAGQRFGYLRPDPKTLSQVVRSREMDLLAREPGSSILAKWGDPWLPIAEQALDPQNNCRIFVETAGGLYQRGVGTVIQNTEASVSGGTANADSVCIDLARLNFDGANESHVLLGEVSFSGEIDSLWAAAGFLHAIKHAKMLRVVLPWCTDQDDHLKKIHAVTRSRPRLCAIIGDTLWEFQPIELP